MEPSPRGSTVNKLAYLATTAMIWVASAWPFPLRAGDTWKWQVTPRLQGTVDYRTATVLDSIRVEQGVIWNIAASDSLGKKDTARVLVQDNGHQSWLRNSELLTFDLQPYDSLHDTPVVVGGYSTYRWGEFNCSRQGQYDSYQFENSDSGATCSQLGSVGTSSGMTLRRLYRKLRFLYHWDSALGFSSYTFHNSGPDISEILDWELVMHNGVAIAVDRPDYLLLPNIGDSVRWLIHRANKRENTQSFISGSGQVEDVQTTYDAILAWRIIDRTDDPEGGTTLTIRESLEDQSTRTIRSETSVVSYQDGPSRTETSYSTPNDTASILRLQVHSRLGRSKPLTTRLLAGIEPETGWRAYPDDIQSGGYRFPRTNFKSDYETQGIRIAQNQIDSLWLRWKNGYSERIPMGSSSTEESRSTTMRLLAWGLDVSSAKRTTVRANFRQLAELAARYPATSVTWRNAQGRQGTFEARRLADLPASLRGGILFLDAVFPDGSRWSGSRFIPR